MKTKIIGTGLSGLVGSRVVELLSSYDTEDISRKTGTDITDTNAVLQRIKNSSAEVVLHFAAKTDVDGCESEKQMGEQSECWKMNVLGTENVIEACEKTGKRLLYMSTDFVFDGKNTRQGGYTEEDIPDPINWYATTKYEAELRVAKAKIPWTIMRIAYPYRAAFEKNDFFRAMKNRLSNNQPISVITDHIFCPTFIDDLAPAIEKLLASNAIGIYHVTGEQKLSPYDAARLIASVFQLDESLITQTTRIEYFKNKAERPFDLSMNNAKIKTLGMQMKTFTEGLEEIKKQLL